jgi:flagellin
VRKAFSQFDSQPLNLFFWRNTMPSVINTNVSAIRAQQALGVNNRSMTNAMQQLSTGKRINSAADDAAGLALGESMTSSVRGLNVAVRNVNDAVNMMQTAEGAMTEQSNMLQRMRELAVQSASGTYSSTQRSYLNTEFQALVTQIGSIASQSTWNGTTLMNATSTFSFQAGQSSGQSISIVVTSMGTGSLGVATASVTTAAIAATTIDTLDTAINSINSQRATIGAGINQMTYAADSMTNAAANAAASRSTVMDTDYATASTQLAKGQIIQQAATAMLAQANQQPQSVLALLK